MPGTEVEVNLGALFLHYYFDSYPAGPPKPDPTRFEYLELITSSPDFRFHDFISSASTIKKRSLSSELGQAFCRLMLQDHFGIIYFAHMREVLNRPTHAAFEGMRITRLLSGDVPDYLCAKQFNRPVVAEAKGRFAPIDFGASNFQKWRDQFTRVGLIDRRGTPLKMKGFIVATQFSTEGSSRQTCVYMEDPNTSGRELPPDDLAPPLFRVTVANHYARVIRKLGLQPLADSLMNGYSLTRQLSFILPVWTCMTPPFEGVEFVGGFYQTQAGAIPTLTREGWQVPLELGRGHAVFIGLQRSIAVSVSRAARGEWGALQDVSIVPPEGLISSEFSWLPDGTVGAPLTSFLPTGQQTL